jgi:hypothetical protein
MQRARALNHYSSVEGGNLNEHLSREPQHVPPQASIDFLILG